MRVLIDTNILADVLLGREPYYDIAYNILTLCADKKNFRIYCSSLYSKSFLYFKNFYAERRTQSSVKGYLSNCKGGGD